MSRRCFGWLPERGAPTCAQWCRTEGGPTAVSCQLLPLSARPTAVLDQGGTSSCVAHALASAIRIRISLTSRTPLAGVALPSRRWIYRTAREMHAGENEDRGTYISSAISAVHTLGWPTEQHCRWDERKVNAALTVEHRHHAYDQRDAVSEYAIYRGACREAVCDALCEEYPVVFGIEVDEAFADCQSSAVNHLRGPAIGRHAMVVIGYDADSVTVLNSWGTGWGTGGVGRISWDAFVRGARDIRVISWAERATS